MRLVATKRLPLGALLGRDVWSGKAYEAPLLRAGTAVSADYRDALLRAGIHAIYVDDELSAGIEVPQLVSAQTRREAGVAVTRVLDETKSASAAGRGLSREALADLLRAADRIVEDVGEAGGAAFALSDLASADAYTLQHSIDVAALGILLGQRLYRELGWLDYRGRRVFHGIDERLARLGLGLLLHDIGKLTVPSAILHKPGPLDEREAALMREHPLAGLELVKGDSVSPLVKAVIRSHHERWDGMGYPEGRRGLDVHQFARIASVADVYDAVTSERPYHAAASARVGVDVIVAGAGLAFDPEVVGVFRRTVAPYPLGTHVALSDGHRGLVASIPSERLDRPVIRIGREVKGKEILTYEIALHDHAELDIVGGEDADSGDSLLGEPERPVARLAA